MKQTLKNLLFNSNSKRNDARHRNIGFYRNSQCKWGYSTFTCCASSLQLCSVLYKNGLNEFKTINAGILKWMEEKGYNSIDDFKAKLSY